MSNWAEWEDSKRFPAFLRDGQTDFISFMVNLFGMYKPLEAVVWPSLRAGKYRRVIDGTAGAGGPALHLLAPIGSPASLELSDRFPNIPAARRLERKNGNISYSTRGKELNEITTSENDLIVCFNSFHHFDHPTRLELIRSWSRSKSDILIAEVLKNDLKTLLSVGVAALSSFLLTPFVRPFRLDRLLFTYLVPVIPVAIAHDGWMSALKQPTHEEWEEIRTELADSGYQSTLEKKRKPWGCLTYLHATRK